MTISEIEAALRSPAYDFLSTNEHLGNNIILLTVGGSHAYGTETPTSDLDIRGCALNTHRELMTGQCFEQVVNEATDTTIYSFNKLISLLTNCNPNTIEMLGCKKEHYFFINHIGQELLDNVDLFLSQKAAYSFGGYANAQLRRLENKANRLVGLEQQEQFILKTINHVSENFEEKYGIPAGSIRFFIDKAVHEDMETEIFMETNFMKFPVRNYCKMWEELMAIVKSYKDIGSRNSKAIEHGKLGKHMMHLIRLYLMGIDILEGRGVITYREKEHDLLMDIRNGKYIDAEQQPTPEFYEMLNEFEKKYDYAKANSPLPPKPDYKRISNFVYDINWRGTLEEMSRRREAATYNFM